MKVLTADSCCVSMVFQKGHNRMQEQIQKHKENNFPKSEK